MRLLGVGSRFSFLALAMVMLGLSACSSSEASAKPEGTAPGAERLSSGPKQVVRQMKASTEAANPAGAAPTEAAAGSVAGEVRASAAGVSRASADSRAPRTNSATTITSKHLEAELNRLEAELAN